jgi:hypothetical protein
MIIKTMLREQAEKIVDLLFSPEGYMLGLIMLRQKPMLEKDAAYLDEKMNAELYRHECWTMDDLVVEIMGLKMISLFTGSENFEQIYNAAKFNRSAVTVTVSPVLSGNFGNPVPVEFTDGYQYGMNIHFIDRHGNKVIVFYDIHISHLNGELKSNIIWPYPTKAMKFYDGITITLTGTKTRNWYKLL